MRQKHLCVGFVIVVIFLVLSTPFVSAATVVEITKTPYTDSRELYADNDSSTWEDYVVYKIYLDANDIIHVKLEVPEDCDFDLLLLNDYDPSQYLSENSSNVIATSTSWTIGADEYIDYQVDSSGTYYILVLAALGNGTYTLSVDVEKRFDMMTIGLIGGVIGIIILAVAVFFFRKRRPSVGVPAYPTPVAPTEAPYAAAETRFCPYCGAQVPKDASVCPSCGSPLD